MSVSTEVSADGNSLTINVAGRFDFHSHQDFRKAYEQANGAKLSFVVDLGQTEYLDSSALGMLLMLREFAGGNQAAVKIANCQGEIKEVLTIANFQKLFAME